MTKIIQEECVGCGICANICPEGIEIADGKAKIKNEKANCLKEAADACPRNVIVINGENSANKKTNNNPGSFGGGRGMGRGMGQGFGRGQGAGRGMGQGRGRRW